LRRNAHSSIPHQHQDLEEQDQKDQGDLGQVTNAEQQEHDRAQNHFWDWVDQVKHR